jgi:branched-chain amino acid transport system substrate-binding protein
MKHLKTWHWVGVLLSATVAASLGAAQPDQGVTDTEIVVGMSAPFSGTSRSLGIELYRGSMAYLTEVNRSGGVNGRTITVKAYDDGYQPDVAVKNTLKLMLEDKVFTLFDYVGTPTVTRVLPLLKKHDGMHFRLFTSFTGAQPQREAPYDRLAINFRASYRQETEGLVTHFREIGRTRVAVLYQADAYGRSGWVGVRSALAKFNQKMVAEATYVRGMKYTESLSRQVAFLQEAKPDVVITIGAYEASAAFIRDARRGGLTVPIANVSFVGSESMLELLRAEGTTDGRDYTSNLVNSQVVPSYDDATVPVVREYRDLMAQNAATVARPALWDPDYRPLANSFVSLEGFLNAKLLVEVLRRLGPNPTRSQLAETVAGVQGLELGTGHPVSFAPDRNQGSDVIFYTTVEAGRFVEIRDWKGWRK